MTKRDHIQIRVNSERKAEFKKRIKEDDIDMSQAIGLATEEKYSINLTQ